MNPLLLSAIPTLFQGITGAIQLAGGKKALKNLERPEYAMPGDVNSMLTLAAQEAGQPYSQAQLNAMNQNGLSAANMAASARDAGQGAAFAPAIAAREQASNMAIAAQADDMRRVNMARLSDMLGVRAKYKDQEWQMNRFAPYMDNYNEARERIGAGQENLFGALNSGAILGQMAFGNRPTVPQVAGTTSTNTSGNKSISDIIMQGVQSGASGLSKAGITPAALAQLSRYSGG